MKKSTDIRTLKKLITPIRYTIPDTRGLHLWVKAENQKYWIFRYSIQGKRFDTSLGRFPEISLAEAREKVLKLRRQIINGINPNEATKAHKASQLKAQKQSISFREFAENYIERMSPQWSSRVHEYQWLHTINSFANPIIGSITLEDITTQHVLEILTPIWTTKNETARRLRGRIEKIISAATTQGLRTSSNPATWKGHLDNLLPQIRTSTKHHEAMPYKEVPAYFYKLTTINTLTSLALQFTILNASRTGEVIYALRNEVLEDIWTIPAKRMKAKREHHVPLCAKSLEIIGMAKKLDETGDFIFCNNGRGLSNMTMLKLIKSHDSHLTVHGFRSAFRDWVSEETIHSPEVAEMALAHSIKNKVEAAYRRGNLLQRRRQLLMDWEAYCLGEMRPEKFVSKH
jgi:integrase